MITLAFESEEGTRKCKNNPRCQEGPQAARATMSEFFESAPEFTDLTAVDDWASWRQPSAPLTHRSGADLPGSLQCAESVAT